MPSLFLLRHGKTKWTKEKRFTGWGNAPLSKRGVDEALSAARTLKAYGHSFDMCLTSCLERAKHTTQIIGAEMGLSADHVETEWCLNERHYGALQGNVRSKMVQKYGSSDVLAWRSSFHAQPPELTEDDPRWSEQLERLPNIPMDKQPRSESMYQAAQRVLPLWRDKIVPALKADKTVLVVAHTSSIRSLVGSLEGFNEAQSAAFRISTAVPRHYELDDNLKPLKVHDLTQDPAAKIRQWATRSRLNWLGKA